MKSELMVTTIKNRLAAFKFFMLNVTKQVSIREIRVVKIKSRQDEKGVN